MSSSQTDQTQRDRTVISLPIDVRELVDELKQYVSHEASSADEIDAAMAAISHQAADRQGSATSEYADTVYQDRYQDKAYDDHYADTTSYRDAAR